MYRFGPDPDAVYPNEDIRNVCFIKNTLLRPNIIVGDYSYYSDEDPTNFQKCVTHHYEFMGDKLIIGKFCAIASGVEFIMNGANHRMNAVTTYPFSIFKHGWEKVTPRIEDLPFKGDTIVGNDVWIGQKATILPGITIGDGAIIGANATVAHDVLPYHIVAGNPAKVIRKRFDDKMIEHLLKIKWWNWPPQKIFRNLEALSTGDLDKIKNI